MRAKRGSITLSRECTGSSFDGFLVRLYGLCSIQGSLGTVQRLAAHNVPGLAQRAAEAEAIITLRQLHDPYHVPAQLDTDEPTTDPVYLHLWTFRVMAQHLHATATLDQANPAVCHRAVQAAKAFGLIGKIERGEQIEAEQQRLKELIERQRREAKI